MHSQRSDHSLVHCISTLVKHSQIKIRWYDIAKKKPPEQAVFSIESYRIIRGDVVDDAVHRQVLSGLLH